MTFRWLTRWFGGRAAAVLRESGPIQLIQGEVREHFDKPVTGEGKTFKEGQAPICFEGRLEGEPSRPAIELK